jgi:argininosuccinate lyase
MPFRTAHHTTGQIIAYLEQHHKTLRDLSLQELAGFSPLFADDTQELLSPQASISAKRSLGSTSYESVNEQLAFWKTHLTLG